jgi:exonuclease SbcD
MVKILHFADAHIDIAIQGRHDPQTGLAVRTLDFLKSLDTIVDAAISEKVDLVLFAGDAYKDRTPVPTFQREWGKRIMRLSQAHIPTLLLVGNHDLSPASGRAHALQEYETLSIPHVRVASKPQLLTPDDLEGVPLQILALPWVSRSSLMATLELSGSDPAEVYSALEERLTQLVQTWLENVDPVLPVVMTAHASVQGAIFGGERSVMLGSDMVLPGSLVRDERLDYVALGHIHKPQDLNQGGHHPVIYPGSIERVDFGEVDDDKFYIIAHVEQGGKTRVEWHKLEGRRFIDRRVTLTAQDGFMERVYAVLPAQEDLAETILRLVVEYPFEYENLLDEQALRQYAETCLEFHFIRRPQRETRLRLPQDQAISSLTPLDLLNIYWRSVNTDPAESDGLQKLAGEVIAAANRLQ